MAPFSNSASMDAWAAYLAGIATLLLFIPFIPGLRDVPRRIPIRRLIWRFWEQPQTLTDTRFDLLRASMRASKRIRVRELWEGYD
jgi:hypothetical protein